MAHGYEDYMFPSRLEYPLSAADDLFVNINAQGVDSIVSEITALPVESVEFIFTSQTSDLASDAVESTIITAPTGYIYDILGIAFGASPPSGAASGTHNFLVESEAESIAVLEGSSTYTTSVIYKFGIWRSADDYQVPSTEIAQVMNPKGMRVDSTNGLKITYANDTDVTQTYNRDISLWVRKIKVA